MPQVGAGAAEARVRVMIVDDSALMRKLLAEALRRDPAVEVVDTAMDGQFALEHLRRVRPDVLLMDVDMPRLDGLGALDSVVGEYGLPVVMCSTRTSAGAATTLEALRRGAVDFVEKPSLEALRGGEAAREICAKVRAAAGARVRPRGRRLTRATAGGASVIAGGPKDAVGGAPPAAVPGGEPPPRRGAWAESVAAAAHRARPEFVAVGTSTGGPPALELLLTGLPADFPLPLVVVQHMPPGFTAMLASHLDRISHVEVREAVDGDRLRAGLALVAPGGSHMEVRASGSGYLVRLDGASPLVSGHRPSVDVLFRSAARAAGGRAAALLMTGMGSDGAEGLGELAAAGAVTLAQTPDSCVCHGMPKSAIERGYARCVVPLEELSAALRACGVHAAAQSASQPTDKVR